MKKVFFLLIACTILWACKSEQNTSNDSALAAPDVSYVVETVDILKQPASLAFEGEKVSQVAHERMIYEKNVEIKTRDGTILRANVFRPADAEGKKFPTLVALTPYVKDLRLEGPALHGMEQVSSYPTHELPNPDFWVGRGYNIVWVDSRGTGASNGKASLFSKQEARDYYDCIEWIAEQPWSNGKVATTGISYMAIVNWNVGTLEPPHLSAMIPWEGGSNNYDITHHGGIPSTGFIAGWFGKVSTSLQPEHPEGLTGKDRFFQWGSLALKQKTKTSFFDDHSGDLSNITAPLLSAGNWGGAGLHHPGNVDGFEKASSEHKVLVMNEGNHIGPYYGPAGSLLQLRFVDYHLKGMDTGIQNEPPVRLNISQGGQQTVLRLEEEWPLANTEWTKYYLNPKASRVIEGVQHDGTLTKKAPRREKEVTYDASPMGKVYGGAFGRGAPSQEELQEMWPYAWTDAVTFVTEPMKEDTDIIGPVALKMWVSSSVDDMDIFATIRNIDADGNEVLLYGGDSEDTAPAKGWLRASLRKLDPEFSVEYQPCHAFDEEQLLTPGDVVPVEVRISPLGMNFKKGHRLMLDIQTGDSPGSRGFSHSNQEKRVGENTIYTGGNKASYLILPIIPE